MAAMREGSLSMLRRLIALFVAPLILTGCTGRFWHDTLDHAQVGTAQPVEDRSPDIENVRRDGRFFFAGQPGMEGLDQFAEAGGKMVINLRTLEEMDEEVDFYEEAYVVEELGLEYARFSITPPTLGLEDVDLLNDLLGQTTGPVLIHCGSSNRAGGLWAAYLGVDRNMPVAEAIALGRAAGLKPDSSMEAAALRVIAAGQALAKAAEEMY